MPGQYVGQEERKGVSASIALATIGTIDPLPAIAAARGLGWIVAEEQTVPVQGFSLVTAWTALLLERKS